MGYVQRASNGNDSGLTTATNRINRLGQFRTFCAFLWESTDDRWLSLTKGQ